ncbi:hypothetical protein WR25_13889 isoform B [Diploscapter pachys]|uniref:protein-serine/threonine phosphatase n=2 Tax=Diploscapter pachys TaxID=2018661 RepID=A0A2A2JCD4_9BILA|nr:hypothetical protein WR25_13889 isoform B [Diploscapter pachys]
MPPSSDPVNDPFYQKLFRLFSHFADVLPEGTLRPSQGEFLLDELLREAGRPTTSKKVSFPDDVSFRELLNLLEVLFPDRLELEPAAERVFERIIGHLIRKGFILYRQMYRKRGCLPQKKVSWSPGWCTIEPGTLTLYPLAKNSKHFQIPLNKEVAIEYCGYLDGRFICTVRNGNNRIDLAHFDDLAIKAFIRDIQLASEKSTREELAAYDLKRSMKNRHVDREVAQRQALEKEKQKLEKELESERQNLRDEEIVRGLATRMLEEEKQKSEQMEKVLYELQMKLEGRSSRREFRGEGDDGNEEDTEIEETLEEIPENEMDKEHQREEELRNYAYHLESSSYDADDEDGRSSPLVSQSVGMSIVQVQRTPSPSVGDESESFDFDDSRCSSRNRSISECYFAVKGAAVILPHSQSPPVGTRDSFSASEIQEHLPLMIKLLRQNDSLNMAVCLQTNVPEHIRYLVIVTTNQATEGNDKDARTLLIGMDYFEGNISIGVVLPLLWCSEVKLTGDGGVVVYGSARTPKKADNTLLFRPTSVQTMWFVFQFLHRELERTIREMTGRKMKEPSLATEHYMDRINSPVILCAQWQQSPLDEDEDYGLGADVVRQQGSPGENLSMQSEIRRELRHVMQSLDLEQVTSRDIKEALTQELGNVDAYKEFIEIEMLVILGQMEKPSQIFDYLYLGNEWNASNYDELMSNEVGYILNMTREVDNFFPQQFCYRKYLVSDEPSTQLLSHWNETTEFIKLAKESGKKCLVHCKKGVSRSSSTVIAYIMKEYGWALDKAVDHVKKRRNCITPNRYLIYK